MFPITIQQQPGRTAPTGTANAVQVRLVFTSDNRQRLTIKTIDVPPLPAQDSFTVNAEVTAKANGIVPVTAQLETESGAKVGRPFAIEVQVTQNGTTGWVIALAAGLVLVGTTALRIRTVARERAAGRPAGRRAGWRTGGRAELGAADRRPGPHRPGRAAGRGCPTRVTRRTGAMSEATTTDAEPPSRRRPRTAGRTARLISASAVMAAGTALSRVMGFFRLMLLVFLFGNGTRQADMFTIANTVPNSMYILLAGGVLNTVLVPQIVRAIRSDNDRGEAYTNRIMTAGLLVLGVITVLLTLAVPVIIQLYSAGGWKEPALPPSTTR